METSNKLIGEQLSLWTSSAADIPANHLALQDNAKEQTTQDTCGHGYEQPLANYDHATQSWKTCEDISLWGEQKSLERLPKSGMTRNGVLYQQPEWVRPIDVNESSLWPTPTTQEVEHPNAELTVKGRRKSKNGKTSHSLGLADAVQIWPTPQARDWKGPSGRSLKGTERDLPMAVKMWPTPTATEHKYRLQGSSQASKNLNALHGGKLNPMWVEWLMGFPVGWTDLKD
jgi:hypothetical protein